VTVIAHPLPESKTEVGALWRTARVHDFGTIAIPDRVSGIEFGVILEDGYRERSPLLVWIQTALPMIFSTPMSVTDQSSNE
jgi:hypothetical protein